ncbi:unnamed protein product, partial [Scytosiphon promiscuus]
LVAAQRAPETRSKGRYPRRALGMSTAAPMDGLSLSDEASLSQLRQRLQRDVNCLSDPDRSTRKRALTKLRKAIFQEAKIPEVVLRGFLTRHLAERLVGMLADPVEKCREMAGGLLLEFVGAVDDVRPDAAALAKQLFPMAGTRIGSVPLVEPAEEVRALVLRLCGALLRGKSAESFGSEVAEEACGILSAALTDPFPEVKRECCSLLLRLAAVCPGELRSRMGKVLRPLIVNLGHQHSKTRQMTLQALGALLLCGSDDLDKPLRELILPQFGNLLYDRTVAVRRELAGVLAALVEAGFPDTPPSSSSTDDHNPGGNPAASLVTAMDVGEDDHTSSGDNCGASEPDGRACPLASARRNKYLEPFRAELVSLLMKLLADESEAVCEQAGRLLEELGEVRALALYHPPPLPSRPARPHPLTPLRAAPPAPAARALCASLLPLTMPAAIEEASHWTVRGRRRALRLLCFLVQDDELEVRQAVDKCAAAVGEAPIDLAAVLDVLLPILRGEGLLGADPSSSSAEGGGEELWEAGLEACRAVVGTGLGEELRRPQARLDVRAQDLFARHFTDLLAYVVGEGAGAADAGGAGGSDGGGVVNGGSEGVSGGGWDRGSRRRTGFEALLRSAPGAVGEHLGEVMPIFRGLLHDPKRWDPELRLSMLALLECVVKQDKVTEESMRPHAQLVLREMVLPNAVWRAGLVAATVAIAVLYTSLRGNKIGVEAVYATAEQLLPVLKTNLEDHESTTRQMTCLSLEMMFRLMPGALGEEPVRLIYPELLKRLDDSNDAVRLSVCGTIAAFFRATAPQNIRGSVLKYSSEQLLVHLDDNDESMQRAVFSVMEVAIAIDPESVKKLASDARASHRAPDY